jgi:HEXXH motif-containing protein
VTPSKNSANQAANLVELPTHHLPGSVFDQICAGPVDAAGMAVLREGQRSTRLVRLLTVLRAAAASADRLGPFATVDQAWELLIRAERGAPEVVEDILMYPTVGVWLSHGLRHALDMAQDTTSPWSVVGGLHAIAAAAAYRCRLDFAVAVPVVHGTVNLPTVGVFRLANSFPVGHVVVRNGTSGLSVEVCGAPADLPLVPLTRHRATARGMTVEVVIDDLDPYREFTGPIPPRPLSGAERAEWRKFLDEAWDLLTATFPHWAVELSAGLRQVVPLSQRQQALAASSEAAFGAIAMAPKRSALYFAESMVHEIQHSKVNSLLDLVTLAADDGVARHYAPWLDQPRPLTALLHGVYAFCCVVEFWHVQRRIVPEALAAAGEYEFAYRHRQVTDVLRTLRGRTELTRLGRRFVTGVATRVAACPLRDVPAAVVAAVDCVTSEHRALWRLRHVRPDEHHVTGLATAWLRRARPAPAAVPETVTDPVPTRRPPARTPLSVLAEAGVRAPAGAAGEPAPNSPEAAYLAGDRRRAAELYSAAVRRDPDDLVAWCGLSTASPAGCLRGRPDLVRALYVLLARRTRESPDPVRLAAWLDQAAN